MIKEINPTNNGFEIILYNGTILLFSAHYSTYEDCVNLLLQSISSSGVVDEYKLKNAYIGSNDNASEFADKF